MIQIDKTQPRECVVLDASNEAEVMPVLTLLDGELKVHGLEFVITKDRLGNGAEVKLVEVRKRQIKRTRKSKKHLLG